MKNKKSIIALLIVAIIGIVGLTLAYFSNSDTIENQFITKEYGSTYTEEFVSPDNWLPGDTTDKTVVVENTGQVDEAVRIKLTESWTTHNNGTLNGWIHPDGTKSTHTTETELSTDESVAILNLANTSDWTKVGDYYYYNYKLAPGESTTSFLESVTFNSKTKLDDTCVTTIDGSTKTVTCNSSGDDYDNATYKLTFTIETVQYNKFASAWNTGSTVTIAEEKNNYVYTANIDTKIVKGSPIPEGIVQYSNPEDAMAAIKESTGGTVDRPFYLKHKIKNGVVEESYVEFIISEELAQNNNSMQPGIYDLLLPDSQDKHNNNTSNLSDAFGTEKCIGSDTANFICAGTGNSLGGASVYNNFASVSQNLLVCRVSNDGAYCEEI